MEELKLNNIYNMDCVEGLKKIPDNSVDLIVTSPPYNVGIKYDVWDDNMPWDKYLEWCKVWLTECYRVLKDDGRICINHALATSSPVDPETGKCIGRFPLFDFRNIMMEIGFTVYKLAVWDDPTCADGTAWGSWLSASAPNVMTPFEGILISYKNQWKKIEKGESTIGRDEFMECCFGVWHIGTTPGYTKCCFPEKLPHMCINLLSYKGDVVLDPFSGSGTTCYVAKGLERKFIGFEISPNYWCESISRLNGEPYKVTEYDKEKVDNKENLW